MPVNINDFGDKILAEAASRVSKRLKKLDRTQHLIASGRGILAESKIRRREFSRRQKMLLNEEANPGVPRGQDDSALGLEKKSEKLMINYRLNFWKQACWQQNR